jgi:hypothetical protein
MNSIIDHELLLDKWAAQTHHSGKGFVRDGIIDMQRWVEKNVKILFLLKEAYSDPSKPFDWDLRVLLRDEWKGPKGVLFWNAAYWAYLIHKMRNESTTPPLPNSSDHYVSLTNALLSTAVVNVKKSSGQPYSDIDEIKHYAQLDSEFLKLQIDIIDPTIIVCGSTWNSVKHIWPDTVQVYDLVWTNNTCIFIDFWHPANQFPSQLNYHSLADILRSSGALQKPR